jgi:hypothetical protein
MIARKERSAVRFKEVEYENIAGKENRDDPDLHRKR